MFVLDPNLGVTTSVEGQHSVRLMPPAPYMARKRFVGDGQFFTGGEPGVHRIEGRIDVVTVGREMNHLIVDSIARVSPFTF